MLYGNESRLCNGTQTVATNQHIRVLQDKHIKQSGRSPKIVALFSATNFSSYIIELLQLHDTFKLNKIMHQCTIISPLEVTWWYKDMWKISFLLPNLVAFLRYTINIHLKKWLLRCDTKRAIWWDLCSKYISIFCSKHMSTIFCTLRVNKW